MRTILFIALTSLIFVSCQDQDLREKEAMNILKDQLSLPIVIDYDLFFSDPDYAKNISSTDLAKNNWLTIQDELKVSDQSLITFTRKSTPYLLPTPKEYRKLDIQKVKIAEIHLDKIISIQYDEDKKLTEVEYTTRLQNVTPFSILAQLDLTKREHKKAYFSFTNEAWQLVKGENTLSIN